MRSLPVILFLCATTLSAQTPLPLSTHPPDQCTVDATKVPGTVFRVSPTEHKPIGDPALVAAITQRENRGIDLYRKAFPGQLGFNAEYARNWTKNPKPDKPEPYHASGRRTEGARLAAQPSRDDWTSNSDYGPAIIAQSFEKNRPFGQLQDMIDK